MTNIFTYAAELHDKMSQTLSRIGETLTDKIEMVQQLREGVPKFDNTSLGKFSGSLENLFNSSSSEAVAAAVGMTGICTVSATLFGAIADNNTVGFATASSEIWTAAREFLNAAMPLDPAGFAVAPIIALVAIIGHVAHTTESWGQTCADMMKRMSLGFERFTTSLSLKWLEVKNEFHRSIALLERDWYDLRSVLDQDRTQAGLAPTKQERDERTSGLNAIADRVKDISARIKAMTMRGIGSVGKGAVDVTTDLKRSFGLQPAAVPERKGEDEGDTVTVAGIFTPEPQIQATAGIVSSISGGGRSPEAATININLDNLIHTMTINCGDMDEGAEKLRDIVLDELSRALKIAQANA